MKYFLLGEEQSAREIADRVYRNLTPTQRARAEAALIRENPELNTSDGLLPGALIRIPTGSGHGQPDKGKLVDPVSGMVNSIVQQLKTLESEVKANITRHEKQLDAYPATLKEARGDLKDDAEAEALSERLMSHVKGKSKAIKEKKERGIKAIKTLRKSAGTIR
ncbi:MAG TPA: hypothetical protein VKN35_11845 [Xanthomonadales bacterium]|nr:hypothetical protein [Xanthomonadales bacterium]